MIAFVVGFIIGYVTTIPVGPINLAVMMKALHNRTGQAMMIGTGSALMDIIYCAAALFGISTIISNPTLELMFRILPFLIFFYYGVRVSFFKLPEPHLTQNPEDAPGFKRFFLLGMAMYFSNPSFIAYWVTIAGIVHGYHLITPTMYDNAMFAVGTGAGVTIWFATLVGLVEKHKVRFDPKTLHRVTRFFGLVMLIVSIILGWNLFTDLVLKQ
ncbi:MAG: LysE family transporter [Bacteroidota bacterium]